jgi:hypothetical protein
VQLSLQESYSLPILTYAISALNLSIKQSAELNACWNSVYRRIFGFNRWESVKCFVSGMGRLDFYHIVSLQKVKFYFKLYLSKRSLLSDMFWFYFTDFFTVDTDLVACSYIIF